MKRFVSAFFPVFSLFCFGSLSSAEDWNRLILDKIAGMPKAGVYARYQRDLPEKQRFSDLYETVDSLGEALEVTPGGSLKVVPEAAAGYSFCSSATYLLFCEVVSELQKRGIVAKKRSLSRELAKVGDCEDVIHGRLDGVGLFGHWNADGPGTAVLFERLDLGSNFLGLEHARPGDFLKIFWNEHIGKGERGHLVIYLGKNDAGTAIEVWSSNMENGDGTAGYGTMWVETSRIQRALLSRLERPENLLRWLEFPEAAKTSDYLVRIRRTGSSPEEMAKVTRAFR